MGRIAESILAYAQPLLDETDGSHAQMESALAIAQLCWTLALLPEAKQEESLARLRPGLKMDDAKFAEFRKSIIAPMIARHREMFPNMPRMDSKTTTPATPEEKRPGTRPNDRCPCGSGRKYKRCCGR